MNLPEILWPDPPRALKLGDNEVHIWCASLDQTPSRLEGFAQTLSDDERARAARFHFAKDRDRFIAGRGLLREMLGRLLNLEPAKPVFCYGTQGKPQLADPLGGRWLQFNLAHSDSLAVYAVAWEHEIGIDIEHVRPVSEAEMIANRFFSERENAQWRSLPASLRPEAFFNCWTRKEAYLKANGKGIAEPLDQIEVSLVPGEPAQLINLAGDARTASHWLIQLLTPANDCVGALAVKKRDLRVACWRSPEA